MNRITALAGAGVGFDLIMVGGGHSVADFDFSRRPGERVMALNDALYVGGKWHYVPDYICYYDANMIRVLQGMKIQKETKVIGYNNSMWPGLDFDYRMTDVHPTRQHHCIAAKALVIACNIMRFNRVFLVGIDFTAKEIDGKTVSHFQGDPIGPGLKYSDETHFKTHLGNLDRTEEFTDLHFENVYNCNPESKLRKYEFKKPY